MHAAFSGHSNHHANEFGQQLYATFMITLHDHLPIFLPAESAILRSAGDRSHRGRPLGRRIAEIAGNCPVHRTLEAVAKTVVKSKRKYDTLTQ
jgi:hypothetical protein